MKNQNGFITGTEILIIVILLMCISIPITCHQSITRRQAIMAKTGVEMSYWDVFWVNPEIRYNQGTITINNNKKDLLDKSKNTE